MSSKNLTTKQQIEQLTAMVASLAKEVDKKNNRAYVTTKTPKVKQYSKFYIGLPVTYNGVTRYQSTHLVYTDAKQAKNAYEVFKTLDKTARVIGVSGTGKSAKFEVVA